MTLLRAMLLICLASLFVIQTTAQDTAVTLTETEITWTTTSYERDEAGAIIPSSVDNFTLVERTFDAYVLENEYLQVTLLPEYGGRILSIIYKPTGQEQLYQNPVGVPYGIGDGNFYYDWLMVYGGIFPTFPAPEHGKAWFLPWDFDIISETDDSISIAMSFVDDITFEGAPARFNATPTGLEVAYVVTLDAGRKSVDAQVTITNPTDRTVNYEYWTCITLAPGSDPTDTRIGANAEIIAPIDEVRMPPWWPDTVAQETATNILDVYVFDNLRLFENWADMGIAYAYPNIGNNDFWGVIDQDTEAGLIRVGDNDITQGLKIWTWGYESADVTEDAYLYDERRPYIELWAGVSPEFFIPTFLRAEDSVTFDEHYIPTVGLSHVTDANADYLVDFYTDDTSTIALDVFAVDGITPATVIITQGDEVLLETALTPEASDAESFSVTDLPSLENMRFSIVNERGDVLLTGTLPEVE